MNMKNSIGVPNKSNASRSTSSPNKRTNDKVLGFSIPLPNQIRDKFPEACMAALNMFKVIPPGFYVKHLGKPTRGKIASLSFSDSGEACPGMPDFCRAKILDVTHLIPCWSSPGVTMLFLQFANRLSILLSWVDDCISLAEADGLERDLRRILLEGEL